MASFITSRIVQAGLTGPAASAAASTSAGMPSILVSSCRAVTNSAVPATLKSMSPKASSAPRMSVRVVYLPSAKTRPMAMPATGAFDGHAGVHQRQRRGAHRRHRRGAVRRQHLGHEAQGVGELLLAGHDGQQRPLGQRAVADLAALGRADAAGLAVGPRGHVVVVQVALVGVRADGVEHLVHAGHGQRGDGEHLGLTPLEQARAVRRGQHAHLGRQRPQVRGRHGRRCGRRPRRSACAPASW